MRGRNSSVSSKKNNSLNMAQFIIRKVVCSSLLSGSAMVALGKLLKMKDRQTCAYICDL